MLIPFDFENAKWISECFSASCGIGVWVLNPEGRTMYACGGNGCAFCQGASSVTGHNFDCAAAHRAAALEAARFGGRYIYLCKIGFLWCTAPIMMGNEIAGSLAAGPVLASEPEDFIDDAASGGYGFVGDRRELVGLLTRIPHKNASDITPISGMLLAASLYVSDTSRELLGSGNDQWQQRQIGQQLQRLKLDQAPAAYPMEKENELVSAIAQGDQPTARRLLNELLGHILFASGGAFPVMLSRSVELISVLSRAACSGGGDPVQVLDLNHTFLQEIISLHTSDALIRWLNRAVERYTGMVFSLIVMKHRDILYRAVAYMKQAYIGKLTLTDVARHVGFTPAYLSQVFSGEMGETFHAYLTRLRVEQAARLLLGTNMPVGDVCCAAGFEDPSYFIRVFRKRTGTTPGQYRKKQGRLDPKREYGLQ